jgi:hypothetical protein
MRTLFCIRRGIVCLWMVCAARVAFGCDQLPAGQTLWVRLTSPVSTYTAKAGDEVHAVLTRDLVCDNEVVLAMGSGVDGVVRSKRKVGWGIRHETAALELEFDRADDGSGLPVEFTARVEEVENARELVRKGVIQGIRSSDTFQGRINSRLIHLPTWNPYSDPVLIAYKAVFPIFPEPEIYYPAGTDIRLRTTSEVSVPSPVVSSERESSLAVKQESERMGRLVSELPLRVTTGKNVDADLINVVFLGSEDAVRSAFGAAGWDDADPVSKHAAMKSFYALLNNSGYARQPMMTFYMDGRPQDMSLQKSLNSYDRRDHLRIWRWNEEENGEQVWVSSSTHDTGAVLALKHRGFVHHIAPAIDDERAAIIRDLEFAGCVRSVNYVARPGVPAATRNAVGDAMHTDGAVAVLMLQGCRNLDSGASADERDASYKAGNHMFRFFRRQILTFRNDILRANIIYGAYDVARMTTTALRRQTPVPPPVKASGETAAFHSGSAKAM